MTPEAKLAAFFAEAAPPARDYAFQVLVSERIARRRALLTVLALVPWTTAAVALCWALGPLVQPAVEAFGQALAPSAAILGLTALGVWGLRTTGLRLARVRAF